MLINSDNLLKPKRCYVYDWDDCQAIATKFAFACHENDPLSTLLWKQSQMQWTRHDIYRLDTLQEDICWYCCSRKGSTWSLCWYTGSTPSGCVCEVKGEDTALAHWPTMVDATKVSYFSGPLMWCWIVNAACGSLHFVTHSWSYQWELLLSQQCISPPSLSYCLCHWTDDTLVETTDDYSL